MRMKITWDRLQQIIGVWNAGHHDMRVVMTQVGNDYLIALENNDGTSGKEVVLAYTITEAWLRFESWKHGFEMCQEFMKKNA